MVDNIALVLIDLRTNNTHSPLMESFVTCGAFENS